MKENNISTSSIYVKLGNNIGTIIASEIDQDDAKLVRCDGRTIRRTCYPELFEFYGSTKNTMTLPNYENLLSSRIHFYVIAKY